MYTPFDIIRCSWPRPVTVVDDVWTSEPEWDAPPMPYLPQPDWVRFGGELCWTIDWRDWFRRGLRFWQGGLGGEMRGFHIVFQVRVNGSGRLVFWDDDGCLIRRNGELVHQDRTVHPPTRSEITVSAGDRLEIAQWQHYGGWLWGAHLLASGEPLHLAVERWGPYREAVLQGLSRPNGPPLKLYCSGQTPLATVLALYSLILNGYRPAQVFLFGENQWSARSRDLFEAFLPFAQVVSPEAVLARLESLGGTRLVQLAQRHWFVMKTCVSLLYPPHEFCLMDDDVFILGPVEEALHAFQQCNLVFAPDADYSASYLDLWGNGHGHSHPLSTGRLNAGLYWLRNLKAPDHLAAAMLRVAPGSQPPWHWEQGFIATQFAADSVFQLPTQRYFYPYFDGLPGGMLGYDYARNPCGFVSIHYGGLAEKPSDDVALVLAADILERSL